MKFILSLLLILLGITQVEAQLAVKSNLLYDATTTPNLGLEYAISQKSSINLVYGLNPWEFDSEKDAKMAKHWSVTPEYRWWLCSVFNGHFFGIHAMGGEFNASNISIPLPGGFVAGENLVKGVKDSRYQGGFAGGGITYGYQYILSRHWNLEAEIGVGYDYVWYDQYRCGDCGGKISHGHTNYVGITKLGVSFLYLF